MVNPLVKAITMPYSSPERAKEWRISNKQHLLDYNKTWRQVNPEKDALYSKRTKLKAKYGITPEQKDEILKSQNYRCAICKSTDFGSKNWCVDHDHYTGEIRGLLCNGCNTGLGHFKENVRVLSTAILYLRKQINVDL